MEQLVVNLQNVDAETMNDVVDYLDEMIGKNPDVNIWELLA